MSTRYNNRKRNLLATETFRHHTLIFILNFNFFHFIYKKILSKRNIFQIFQKEKNSNFFAGKGMWTNKYIIVGYLTLLLTLYLKDIRF